jgi:hypothetical protein
MKKIIFVLTGIFMTSLTVNAQISLRPHVGINSSKLTQDFNDAAWQSGLGYQVGIDAILGNRLYFQPGLQWELIRQDFNPETPLPSWNTEFRNSHIRIPLMIGMRAWDASNGGLLNIRFYTGPDIAFTVSNSDHSFLGIELNKERLNNLHWSWNGGIGVDILFLFIDVGYKFGLSEYFASSVNNGSRTNVFFANAGIRFGL